MSTTAEILKKLHRIEIKSRGLSNQIFSGEYHSAFKGRGMTFSEVREYQFGDEIRTIDWNVTARFNHPFVKVYQEEREMTVMLLIDVSASTLFGTSGQSKRDYISELAATLAFSAIQNNDKIGVLFFTDKVELFIPPKKGKSHVLSLIKTLLEFKPVHTQTKLDIALRYFSSALKRRCTAFVISDFMDDSFFEALKITNRKHDVVALKVEDKRERSFTNIGLQPFQDMETGEVFWIDTSLKSFSEFIEKENKKRNLRDKDLFAKAGVDFAILDTDTAYVKPLLSLFKRREGRR